MKILVRDAKNDIIFKSLDNACLKCEKECDNNGSIFQCPENNTDEMRQGKRVSGNGSFFLCCDKSVAKTTKLFKEKLEMLIYSVPTIKDIKEKVYIKTKQFEQDKYQRIVHNLKTLNAQSIQEQFSLISQELLAENYNDQFQFVKKEITRNPEKAAEVFLRMAMNNASIKTEFVTHDKLSIENPVLSINSHNIRSVILNVYHAFVLELKTKNVRMVIFSTKKHLQFDYDTVRVAFYHLLHNATKYIKPNSILLIECNENLDTFHVSLKMESIHIEESELTKIFDDNYSGKRVVEKNKQGAGIGMGLIRKALELNNATIEVNAGKEFEKKNKVDYSKNEFTIAFKC